MRPACKILLVTFAVLFTIGSPSFVPAAEAPLPAVARLAYDKGLIAAEQQAWNLAISNFTDAQKADERHPRILYSLGLAHARAGHEAAATAWLKTYLAAAPGAVDADAVRQEMARLESATDSKIRKIYEAAQSAANQVPAREIRLTRLYNLAVSQANSGYFKELQQTTADMCNAYPTPGKCDNLKEYFLWKNYIKYLADVGEFQKAKKLADSIEDLALEIGAQCNIIEGHVSLGDCKTAGENLTWLELRSNLIASFAVGRIKASKNPQDDIDNLSFYGHVTLRLSEIYAKNGQPEDYRRTLTAADRLATEYSMEPKLRSEIAAALKKDPAGMKTCPDLGRMDQVKEWIRLARETDSDRAAVDLEGRLLETKKETSSDKLSNGLTEIADDLAQRMKKIRVLDKQCELASSLKK
jgi:hypothetical protein